MLLFSTVTDIFSKTRGHPDERFSASHTARCGLSLGEWVVIKTIRWQLSETFLETDIICPWPLPSLVCVCLCVWLFSWDGTVLGVTIIIEIAT